MPSPFGYGYADGLDSIGASTKPWHPLPIDECKEARSISLDFQEILAREFLFAKSAYDFHSKVETARECLIEKSDWQESKNADDVRVDTRWERQLGQLCSFGIAVITTAAAMILCSGYFAIEKAGKNVARSIFSGKYLSKMFKRPLPVNLPHMPTVLSTIARILKGRQAWLITADLRNYFHQIAIHHEVGSIFTVPCGANLYSWRVLPMGFSYSPRHAQALAWAALLKQASTANGLLPLAQQMKEAKHPPAFGILHDEASTECGIILIWYDNFIVICSQQGITNNVAKALKDMSKLGFIWGQRSMFHPKQLTRLATEELTKETKEWAIALGLQFGLSKRDRTGNQTFMWRLKPATSDRAELLLRQLRGLEKPGPSETRKPMSCRMIARIVGSAVWQGYISGRPLFELETTIEIASLCGSVAAKTKCWDTAFHLNSNQTILLEQCLEKIIRNDWQTDPTPQVGEMIFAASDASADKGAWVQMISSSEHRKTESWCEDSEEHIFIKELRAAVRAILALAPEGGTLVLAIDNTAAAAVLKNWYSSSPQGISLAKEAHAHLTRRRCRLIVAGIPGVENYADALTWGGPSRPTAGAWCSVRRQRTWEALQRAQEGTERREENPNRRSDSHEEDELEQMMADLRQLQHETQLTESSSSYSQVS